MIRKFYGVDNEIGYEFILIIVAGVKHTHNVFSCDVQKLFRHEMVIHKFFFCIHPIHPFYMYIFTTLSIQVLLQVRHIATFKLVIFCKQNIKVEVIRNVINFMTSSHIPINILQIKTDKHFWVKKTLKYFFHKMKNERYHVLV